MSPPACWPGFRSKTTASATVPICSCSFPATPRLSSSGEECSRVALSSGRRVWQIYAAHILLFVIYLVSVHFLSSRFNASDLIDRFNVAALLNAPGGKDHVGAVAPIQAAEPGCAAALRRPDGHLSAGSLADAQAPELGHPWIGIALFPSPTIWLEFVLLSVGCLVFQPVRVAASFRAGSVA